MKPAEAKAVLERTRSDPAWWVRTVLGDRPWARQVEILEALKTDQEVAVASCHGAGKSFIAARAVLWFLCAYQPAIVLSTAPSMRQVRGILWKEIRLAHQRAKVPLGGTMLTQELRFNDDWWALGFTAPEYDPDKFQGFHEQHVLVVADEACGISNPIFEGIDAVLSNEHARLLMIGNPTEPSGRFGQSFKTADVRKIRISAFDTPNFTSFGITREDIASRAWEAKIGGRPLPYPKLVTPAWVAKRYQRWGPTSSLYLSRVEAQFPEAGTDTLIPLAWVEAAQQRNLQPGKPVELGVDVARFGDDETVIALRRGSVVRVYETASKQDTMQTAGRAKRARVDTLATAVKVDVVGVGGGVVDRLKEQGEPVSGVNVGEGARDSERFVNRRAELYWGLRERFETGDIDLDPTDDELAAQLCSIRFRVNSRGQIVIESKEDAKKRGISSPDRADAVMLAFAPAETSGFFFV